MRSPLGNLTSMNYKYFVGIASWAAEVVTPVCTLNCQGHSVRRWTVLRLFGSCKQIAARRTRRFQKRNPTIDGLEKCRRLDSGLWCSRRWRKNSESRVCSRRHTGRLKVDRKKPPKLAAVTNAQRAKRRHKKQCDAMWTRWMQVYQSTTIV